ncbi:MAG: TonB-dependent receptor [Pyrinomonadaceae bacterium]|nr:TonB-dependent receptor [Pyrinomonadaceae bacterium]
MYFCKFIIAVLIIASCGFQVANAQQNVSAATLSGIVKDSNNLVISGATITAKNIATNQTQSTISDDKGEFRFAYLPVGNYEIKVEQVGFEVFEQNLTAAIGQVLDLRISLNVKAISEQIEVSSATPTIETARTQISETILPKDVEDLPLNGRNFLDLALLIPAVSRTNTGNVQRFAETSAVPGTGISVAGQRNLANSFIVDGSSANDDAVELAGTYYSQEVIREFQVVTNGAVAEFGRASSGFVNIVTNSGTNDLRGKLYGFFRNQHFDARNPVATSKDPLTQTQYGANFGAPIIKNRTFLFSNFEQTRRNDSNIITISPANVAAINNRLRATNYRGQMIQTGLVAGGYDTTNVFTRVDNQINARNAFAATYNFYAINAVNARTVGGLNDVTRGTNLDNKDHTVNTQNVTSIGSRSLNEARFQFRHSRLAAPAIDGVNPSVSIAGVANFGTATGSPLGRDIDLYQFSDAFSTSIANHNLKFGAAYIYNRLNIVFPGATVGTYTFTSLANFQSGTYNQFQQAFGATSQSQNNPNFGIFAQDEWKARRNLTLNFGLRYDLQFLPDPIKTDKNNVSPRFGFAYSPDSKTVIRGSFGLYFDRIPLRATSNALQRDGSKYVVVQLAPNQANAPIFPNVLANQPSTFATKPNVTRIDPNIENNSSQQANLQIERELPFQSSISFGYIYLRGLNIILSRNVNVPTCEATIDPNRCRPDANFGNISRFEGSGDSSYNGFVFSFNKRQGNWTSARVSYTLSKAIDNAGNFFFSSPQNNFNLRDDKGLSDNDQRNRLTLSGTFNAPRNIENGFIKTVFGGFQTSYIFTYASRLPFNVLTGNDRNGDTNNNDRPIGTARNTGKGFDFSSLDVRVSRRFQVTERFNVEFLAEGFNILNHANYSVPNNVFGTGTTPLAAFGTPTAAFDPRQIQFGMRLNF